MDVHNAHTCLLKSCCIILILLYYLPVWSLCLLQTDHPWWNPKWKACRQPRERLAFQLNALKRGMLIIQASGLIPEPRLLLWLHARLAISKWLLYLSAMPQALPFYTRIQIETVDSPVLGHMATGKHIWSPTGAADSPLPGDILTG
jgi:hypothetical protein